MRGGVGSFLGKSLNNSDELIALFNDRPELLKKLQEAIENDAIYQKSIDIFFETVKTTKYRTLSTKTIASHELLQSNDYKELRDFLNNAE
jgi:hypothetical protein